MLTDRHFLDNFPGSFPSSLFFCSEFGWVHSSVSIAKHENLASGSLIVFLESIVSTMVNFLAAASSISTDLRILMATSLWQADPELLHHPGLQSPA